MPELKKLDSDSYKTLENLWKLEKIILDTLDFRQVIQRVVDSILLELGYLNLGYKVVVLALIDEEKQTLERVSLSHTLEAKKTREVSNVPFENIVTPLSAKNNLCIQAIEENKPKSTHYFPDILTPPVSPENALESQKNAGILTSLVYPLSIKNKAIGVLIFSMTKSEQDVTDSERSLIQHFTDLVALAVQNSRLYSDVEEESDQLSKANEKLKELDKQKDEFISIAAHELRTPMTIIKSHLWMLAEEKGGPLTEKQKVYITRASRGTERMLSLINDMLDVSRIEQGRVDMRITDVDLEELFKEFIEDFQIKTEEKGLFLNLEMPKDKVTVRADKEKLRQVIINFCGNALKFTHAGGITIKGELQEGEEIKVSVIDTGKGIAPEDIERLFKKFVRVGTTYQSVAEIPGTGLGLYISKNYVEIMGGRVGVFSEGESKGTTFWFTLPLNTKHEEIVSLLA